MFQDLPKDERPPQLTQILLKFFPFHSANIQHSETAITEEEFPLELSFHKTYAPSIPSYSTSLFYSPPCCFCTAKVSSVKVVQALNHCSAIVLSIDIPWTR